MSSSVETPDSSAAANGHPEPVAVSAELLEVRKSDEADEGRAELEAAAGESDGGGPAAAECETDANPGNSEVDAVPFEPPSRLPFFRPVQVPTERDSNHYVMCGTKKLIILNNKHFAPRLKLNTRRGTEVDVKALKSTFKPLGWDISIVDDCTVSNIRDMVLNIQLCQENLAALALFILSHGEDNGTVFAQDGGYRVDQDILYQLAADKCPALAGKPKLIFVQACQGQDTDAGTNVTASRRRHTSQDSAPTYRIPNYADFLIFQASFWQHYSFRSTESGSWFVQTICDKVGTSGPEDHLFDILLDVSASIALTRESNVPNKPQLDKKKQVPLLYSTMLRKLYLKEQIISELSDVTSSSSSNTTPLRKSPVRQQKDKKKSGGVNVDCSLM